MGARSRKGGRRIKRKTQKNTDTEDQAATPPPRAFVFSKGKVSAPLKALVEDLKRVMSPNTAQALRARKTNKLRDFVDVAGELNVSFFLIVSATDKSSYLRVVRTPQGPTLTFRINSYSLASDLSATLRKPYSAGAGVWQSSPLLVLSDFDKSVQHEMLQSTVLQNLFPEFNVADAKLAACRRVVLVHKLPDGGSELRQFVIQAVPTGISKGVKKLMRSSKLPSLGRYNDMADFLLRGGYSSDSGAETDEEDKAELPQDYVGRNSKANQKVSIKLHEVGPRMSLDLVKVEDGLCSGATLYHALVSKTDEEVATSAERLEARNELKEQRRQTQQQNVEAKKQAVQQKADAKVARRKRRRESEDGGGEDEEAFGGDAEGVGGFVPPNMSDAEWYKQEVRSPGLVQPRLDCCLSAFPSPRCPRPRLERSRTPTCLSSDSIQKNPKNPSPPGARAKRRSEGQTVQARLLPNGRRSTKAAAGTGWEEERASAVQQADVSYSIRLSCADAHYKSFTPSEREVSLC